MHDHPQQLARACERVARTQADPAALASLVAAIRDWPTGRLGTGIERNGEAIMVSSADSGRNESLRHCSMTECAERILLCIWSPGGRLRVRRLAEGRVRGVTG